MPPALPADSPELAATRGVVRDGLGAMVNLQQLLRSVRVGPKALSDVLPAVQSSCAPLSDAFQRLVEQIPAPRAELRGELSTLTVAPLREMEALFTRARRGPLRASTRLELERRVAATVSNLGVASTLLSLILDFTHAPVVVVEAAELAEEAALLLEPSAPGSRRVSVTLHPPPSPIMVRVRARAAMGLFAVAASLAADSKAPNVALHLERTGADTCLYRFTDAEEAGSLTYVTPLPIPATATTAGVLADALGGTFERSGGGVVVTLPADPLSSPA